MSFLYPTTPPVKPFYDSDGEPLDGGYIYYGIANMNPETNPVQMYWDAAGLVPAPQPFRTRAGFIIRPGPGGTPANAYADGDYSITIRNAAGSIVFTHPNSVDLELALSVVGAGTAAIITVADAATYYTAPKNVENILQQIGASLASVVLGAIPTGARIGYCGLTAPTGFVLGSGRTIGSAASSATERANADTSALYTLLWNSYSNTELVIQDSAGTPTTRGASAGADFAANKRLSLPDYRGRVGAGKDDMGGSTASRLTSASGVVGTTMGEVGGTETHALTALELTDHTHTATQGTHTHTATQGSHNHTQDSHGHAGSTADAHTHTYNDHVTTFSVTAPGGSFALSSGATTTNSGAANTNALTIAGATATNQAASAGAISVTSDSAGAITVSAASTSAAHQNTQPTIIETVIIKL